VGIEEILTSLFAARAKLWFYIVTWHCSAGLAAVGLLASTMVAGLCHVDCLEGCICKTGGFQSHSKQSVNAQLGNSIQLADVRCSPVLQMCWFRDRIPYECMETVWMELIVDWAGWLIMCLCLTLNIENSQLHSQPQLQMTQTMTHGCGDQVEGHIFFLCPSLIGCLAIDVAGIDVRLGNSGGGEVV